MGEKIFIAILIFAFFYTGWRVMRRISEVVGRIEFTELLVSRKTGLIRLTDKFNLKSKESMKLYAGLNDFYVTVQKGKVKYHSRYVLDTITPIIRDAEDIDFFRVQVRMKGKKIVAVHQTSLGRPDVQLVWRSAMT